MILDKGVCTIFHPADTAAPGARPKPAYTRIFQSWYGELSFETSPVRPTPGQAVRRADARIRILQCRQIRQDDVVVLAAVDSFPEKAVAYRITRAFHGPDEAGTTPITDLTLEVYTP